MSDFLNTLLKLILDFRASAGAFLGPNLYIFELSSIFLSALLLWGIVFTMSESGFITKRIEEWMDYLGYGDVGKFRQLKAWKAILKKMKSVEPIDWKKAIMEADKILDDILKLSGFRSPTTDERFKQLTPEMMPNLDELASAHKIRNRCAQEPDFVLSKDEAVQTLKIYKKSFQEFGILD